MTSVRIVNLGSVSYLESQSFYHAVAICMSEQSPDTVILCRPREPYYCLGYHQSSLQVIDPTARIQLGYPILRRRLGGGLTYLDCQQQFYQCIFHRSRSPSTPAATYRARLDAPIRALKTIGIDAQLRYTNEIEVGGKRIAGIGGGIIGEASVVVGNILNKFNFNAMAQIINVPCKRFRELALEKMMDRITTLHAEKQTSHWSRLPELLVAEFSKSFGRAFYVDGLTRNEQTEAAMQAEIMSNEGYLERRDEIGPKTQNNILTRLKISGSTWIQFVKVNNSSFHTYAILVVKNGAIEYHEFVDDFDMGINMRMADLNVIGIDDISIGKTLH